MSLRDAVIRKRDGGANTPEDLKLIADAAAAEEHEGQLGAWLMASYHHGLSKEEGGALTKAMADSGERLDLDGLPKPWVDKHSTGGVGDKTTIALLPILAACGLTVVKMSGRGLGITGGTIDKVESVPGFRTDLSPEELKDQANEIGLALTGSTPRLAPADKTLYALRDVTGTVDSIPLIAASIMSKKIAGGSRAVVFDVKCGRGGFMKDLESARELRDWLVGIGEAAGLTVRAAITDMDQPLGQTAGNALEVEEAIRFLQGEDCGRFGELVLHMAGLALEAAELDAAPAISLVHGLAIEKAREWFEAQGADWQQVISFDFATAPVQKTIEYRGPTGFVESVDANAIGELVVQLGGGRTVKGAEIDPRVGVEVLVEVGSRLEQGAPMLRIHAASDDIPSTEGVVAVKDSHVPMRDVILE